MKQESMQWKHKGSPTPKKFCVQQSAGRIMVTVFFFVLRRCSPFGIHATQDKHYWRHLCFHNGGFMQEYQTETPWKVVSWYPAASWQCTCTQVTYIMSCYKEMWLLISQPSALYFQTWLPVTTLSSETLKNFCMCDDFPATMQWREL